VAGDSSVATFVFCSRKYFICKYMESSCKTAFVVGIRNICKVGTTFFGLFSFTHMLNSPSHLMCIKEHTINGRVIKMLHKSGWNMEKFCRDLVAEAEGQTLG